jgi:aminopeptidase YwaD
MRVQAHSLIVPLFVLAGWSVLHADPARRVPFWPDAVPAAIQAAVDGGAVLDTVRGLGRFHRVQGSPGFAAAAEFVRAKAEAAGLVDARIERLPADGETRYAHFRSYFGWAPREAWLDLVQPQHETIARFPELRVALADYSQDADVTADLIDVGAGTRPDNYEGKTVAGRLVLASGSLDTVHRLAVIEHGAAGILSDFPNQTSAWSGDDRDLVRWGHLSPYERRNRFAFMLSKRQSEALRARLAAGERVVLQAHVRARIVPSTFDVVSATIPGTDPSAGEVLLTAHLCHQSAGANDDASGSAAILEVGRALQSAIAGGALTRPARTIRFLWVPEIAGSQAWLIRNPEIAKRLVGGIHLDMVGGRVDAIKGTLHLSRTAESLPHALNSIAAAFLGEVRTASAARAEFGGRLNEGFVWSPGGRDSLVADMRPLELGSDHQVFQDSSFRVPMVYFHDWPDVTIHTNKDVPENLDATKLGRVAYMSAGIAWTLAALPDPEVPRLLAVVRADAERRLIDARLVATLADNSRDSVLVEREAARSGGDALRSIARLWPAAASDAQAAAEAIERQALPAIAVEGGDMRVPVRADDVRGPLWVYYFDTLAERLPAVQARGVTAISSPIGGLSELEAFEALNLVDGRRSIADIRDVLTGRYGAVAVEAVTDYFNTLAKAEVVHWR